MSKTEVISAAAWRQQQTSKVKPKPTPDRATTAPPGPKKPAPPPELGIYYQEVTSCGPLTRLLGGTKEQHQQVHAFLSSLQP